MRFLQPQRKPTGRNMLFALAAMLAVLGASVSTALGGRPHPGKAFLAAIELALAEAREISAFRFDAWCRICDDDKLTLLSFPNLPPTVPLGAEDRAYVIKALKTKPSGPIEPVRARRFISDFGLVLQGNNFKALLLVSSDSRSVRLITADAAQIPEANMDPFFPEFANRLREATAGNR
jgi:hypothetical protein